ncbi:DNA-directed DNA polymerase family X beta-like N-terminal [Penicillium hispanicum]|uniref:DNA-directed DNA polymerase family X beta-like N-terminal n=1 Tax=Penicillium hispanicum TaxID=1080232 RepID=UPI0025425C98|nr:DNA-directed DNA polymerase family X beta-like N-terminal [Penicillium hispanicum]KAJ5577659.1 DNA-directed DNA polymerase family X beta-like N-terminal [Penicillium hispanicum]
MSEECANPLLLGWIKEWLDQARERNSKGVTVYKKAYESMKACPLVFDHPSQAQQLNGLGPKLCDRLTEKLKAYCEENGLPMPEPPGQGNKRTSDTGVAVQPAKKPRKAKPYVPALRSGAYALLLGLASLGEHATQGMTKAHLIEVAQPFCDSSFTAPTDPTKFYTAWNSMKTLIQKDLVYEHGRPLRKYALSEDGWEVAKRVQKTLPGSGENIAAFASGDSQNQSSRPAPAHQADVEIDDDPAIPPSLNSLLGQSASTEGPTEPLALPQGSFTIQLVLDTREVRTSTDRDYIANELIKQGITPQVRALELGDAMWVAKCRDPTFLSRHGEESDEVMLDWIVERKRLDDLIGSIKDGRFHEQKFRLRRSGIKHVIYLIEEFSVTHPDAGNGSALKYQEMVASAIASTQVVNGYFIKKTRNLDDSIRYLARMTLLLRKMYGVQDPTDQPSAGQAGSSASPSKVALIPSRRLSSTQSYLTLLESYRAANPPVTYGVTFSTFSALTSKSDVLSLRDVFLKMLMCTRGVTGEKALEIQRRWQTPRELVDAYMALEPKDRETMISDRLQSLVGRKKIAKALSKKIAEVWGEGG